MRKLYTIVLVAVLTLGMLLVVRSFERDASAQQVREVINPGPVAAVSISELPMMPTELLARFSLRMPEGPSSAAVSVDCRLNVYLDVYSMENFVSRVVVQIPVPLTLMPGQLGTLDIGWTGAAFEVKRNGVGVGMITPTMPMGDEVYVSMSADHGVFIVGGGGSQRVIWPTGSLTVFSEYMPAETIVSPRDAASGLPTG